MNGSLLFEAKARPVPIHSGGGDESVLCDVIIINTVFIKGRET